MFVLMTAFCYAHEGEESNAAGENGSAVGFQESLIEQFTQFGTLKQGSATVSNPLNQYLDSSITQVSLNYNFNETEGIQLNIPFAIHRYARPENGVMTHHLESGIGDLSIVNHYAPYHWDGPQKEMTWNLYQGLKLPTGNPTHLLDELQESAGPASAIHGHDLAFGSGSLDFLAGTGVYFDSSTFVASGMLQYLIRNRGAFGYLYGNSVAWTFSPGIVLSTYGHDATHLHLSVLGEGKGIDYFGPTPQTDTGGHSILAGPELHLGHGPKSLALGFYIPVSVYTTGFEAVPSYRIKLTGNLEL